MLHNIIIQNIQTITLSKIQSTPHNLHPYQPSPTLLSSSPPSSFLPTRTDYFIFLFAIILRIGKLKIKKILKKEFSGF